MCSSQAESVYFRRFQTDRAAQDRRKELWNVNNISPAGYVLTFDKSDNLYVTGYYEDIIFKISRNGRILWKSRIDSYEYYWPMILKASGKKLTIRFAFNEGRNKHRAVLSTQNGKLISLR